jgi:hypothetical protein
LPDGTSGIFYARGLDDPNHIELVHLLLFFAQALSGASALRVHAADDEVHRPSARLRRG